MIADRTYLWSLLADNNVAAVAALPDNIIVLREYTLLLNVVEQFAVACLVPKGFFFHGFVDLAVEQGGFPHFVGIEVDVGQLEFQPVFLDLVVGLIDDL